jgi:hypothetical protein
MNPGITYALAQPATTTFAMPRTVHASRRSAAPLARASSLECVKPRAAPAPRESPPHRGR